MREKPLDNAKKLGSRHRRSRREHRGLLHGRIARSSRVAALCAGNIAGKFCRVFSQLSPLRCFFRLFLFSTKAKKPFHKKISQRFWRVLYFRRAAASSWENPALACV
jgi:hypothetical protein